MHENCLCYIQRTTYLLSQLTSQIFLTVAQNCKSHWFSDMNTTSTYTQMPFAWIFWEFTTTTKRTQPWVWECMLVYVTYRLEKIQVPLQGYWIDSLLIHSLQMALGLAYQWPKWHCGITGAAADETWSPPLTPTQSHQQLHGTRKRLPFFIAWFKICCWKNHSLGIYSILFGPQNFFLPSITCLQRGLIFSLFSSIM